MDQQIPIPPDSYAFFYINSAIAQEDPATFLALFFLFLARMLPIISLCPFFGSRVLPHPVKVTFGISLFAVFLPQLVNITTTHLEFNLMIIIYLLKEVFVGVLMGFMLGVPFMIVQNTGMMIDHQRGGASLMVNDPTIQNQSSPLGTLFNLVLIVLFFMIDGPFLVLETISQSYNILPPDKMINPAFFSFNAHFLDNLMKVMGQIMIISTQLAAPALIMILMTDFFLGIANRLAPQVQITFLGMPLKSLLALAIIFFGWQLLSRQMVTESYTWLNYVYSMLDLFAPSATFKPIQ